MTHPDTVAAVATAPGRGAVAMIRVSGPRAMSFVQALAPTLDRPPEPRRAVLLRLEHPDTGRALDRALVTFFEGPASYTGEDLVEISTHGGAFVPSAVLSALEAAGARLARPGEFTERAYLNGKLDLVEAEGVRDVVEAKSAAFHAAALHQMEGGLSGRLSALREAIIRLEVLLAHHIDFPEEDEAPTPIGRVAEEGREVAAALEALAESAPRGVLLREGALVVLAGRPNVGKSSLFNALLGIERAIVTEEPGTTRDALEAGLSIEGYPFRLIDTAGIRDTSGEIERRGVEVARQYLGGADIVVLCVSSEWGWGTIEEGFLSEIGGATPMIVAETKVDRWEPRVNASIDARLAEGGRKGLPHGGAAIGARVVSVSAHDGRGLAALGAAMVETAFAQGSGATETDIFLTNGRQARCVRAARDEVVEFVGALEGGIPAEIASTHLRSAEVALQEVLGVISPDDVLGRLFADFCIGK